MKIKATIFFLGLSVAAFAQGTQPLGMAQTNLDVTNVNASILNGGDVFRNAQSPGFEVPRGSGKHTIYASSLWLGGKDQQNNLYVSSQTYRQFTPPEAGYWPGPVAGSQGPNHTLAYDRFWKVTKNAIQNHIANYNQPGYTIPPDIATWPGNGNTANGEAAQLAPFVDQNNDGIYSPAQGDYPAIAGDQAVYTIMNDKGNVKSPFSPAMNAEVHLMVYGFDSPVNQAVNNTVFTQYRIINRGTASLKDFYAGIWTDFDIGFYDDDFVGCDTLKNYYFGYNGDNFDETADGYGTAPPVQSVIFLDRKMSHFMYYNNNTGPVNGNPAINNAGHFYNYLSGKWKNGATLTYGGDGTNPNNPQTDFMFPGDPVNLTGWTEGNTLANPPANVPADRRAVGSIGPFNLPAGQDLRFTVAYNFSQGNSNLNSIIQSQQDVLAVQNFFQQNVVAGTKAEKPNQNLLLFPNPANDQLTLRLPENLENREAEVLILDATGREVFKSGVPAQSGKNLNLNISTLTKGIYQLSVICGSQRVSSRLVKM